MARQSWCGRYDQRMLRASGKAFKLSQLGRRRRPDVIAKSFAGVFRRLQTMEALAS